MHHYQTYKKQSGVLTASLMTSRYESAQLILMSVSMCSTASTGIGSNHHMRSGCYRRLISGPESYLLLFLSLEISVEAGVDRNAQQGSEVTLPTPAISLSVAENWTSP